MAAIYAAACRDPNKHASLEPPRGSLREPSSLRAKSKRARRRAAKRWLRRTARPLLRRHAMSARLRLRVASALQRAGLSARASTLYLAALALHDGGCKLQPSQLFALIMGASTTLGARRKHGQALWLWQRAKKLWPSSARVRYELARTLCAMGDTTRCFDELRDALDVGRLQRPPAFMRDLAGAEQSPARTLARVGKDRAFRRLRRTSRYKRLRASKRYKRIIRR